MKFISSLLVAGAVAFASLAAQAAPIVLALEDKGGLFYSVGLSTQVGSDSVTRTTPGVFRDEFLINLPLQGWVNASLLSIADVSFWSAQGVEITRAGFIGFAQDLLIETDVLGTTRYYDVNSAAPFFAAGSLILFVEGIAGDQSSAGSGNSFSYSGELNFELQSGGTVPEPASLAPVGLGLVGLLAQRRKRA